MDVSLAEAIKIIRGLFHYTSKHGVPLPPDLSERATNLVGPYGLDINMEPEAFEEKVMEIVTKAIKDNLPQAEVEILTEDGVQSDPSKNTRIIERKRPDDTWERLDSMLQLQTGDTFRMFEYNGKPVFNGSKQEFKATGQPYTNEQGVDTVECE